MSTAITMPAPKTTEPLGGFDEQAFSGLPVDFEPPALRALRERAFARYQEVAPPTNFDESWRRTPPQLFPVGRVTPLLQLGAADTVDAAEHDDDFAVVVSVTEAGVGIVDREGLVARGDITVSTLADAAANDPDGVCAMLGGTSESATWSKYLALAHAFRNVGLFIDVPPGRAVERPVLIRYAMAAEGAALVPQLVVHAGAGSQATVIETQESPGGATLLVVSTKELFLDEGARLKMVSLQEWGDATFQVADDMAVVQRDAQVDWITLNFGTRATKQTFGSDVAGEGASAELDGLFFCHHDQHIDQRTLQIHSAPHTYSRLLYKGAVQDQGHSVYQGVIQAKPGAVKVDAYQTNNNLVLNDGAQVDTIPGLLIDADDLRCSHGATIGNLDPEQLFYLRCRGLSESAARRLLIRGFFSEVAERIELSWIRDRILARIESTLHD